MIRVQIISFAPLGLCFLHLPLGLVHFTNIILSICRTWIKLQNLG